MSLGHRPVRITKRDLPKEPQWLTYADWFLEGRHVRRGEKSIRRDKDGVPLFARIQTDETASGLLQRGTKPDHFEEYDVSEEDLYKDKWLFT